MNDDTGGCVARVRHESSQLDLFALTINTIHFAKALGRHQGT